MTEKPIVSIAIISDLHCQSYSKDVLRTRLHTNLLDNPPNKHPMQALKVAIKENNLKVDYLFVLGDIADKADQQGFIFAINQIRGLFEIIGADKLIYTIGNHDVDPLKKNNNDPEHMLRSTNDFPFFINNNKLSEELIDSYWANRFSLIEDENVIILSINTSYLLNIDLNADLSLNDQFIENLKRKLLVLSKSGKIKIAICHHHPIQHSDYDDRYTSKDVLGNGDKLLKLLQEENFTLIAHGHKHIARLKYDNNLPVFCSGSFSSLENVDYFNGDNTFHCLKIYKGFGENSFKGSIETWIYNYSIGWIKSRNPNVNFPTQTGFGILRNIEDVVDEVYNFYQDKIKKYEDIYYDEIIEKFPDVFFLTPYQQKQFTELILKKYYIEIIPDIKIGKWSLKMQLI